MQWSSMPGSMGNAPFASPEWHTFPTPILSIIAQKVRDLLSGSFSPGRTGCYRVVGATKRNGRIFRNIGDDRYCSTLPRKTLKYTLNLPVRSYAAFLVEAEKQLNFSRWIDNL